jgi:putative toxin-antitoxin system antitoxin component (TIGR02293 family)
MASRSHSAAKALRIERESPRRVEDGSPADLLGMVLNGLTARDLDLLRRFYLTNQSEEQICVETAVTETQLRLLRLRVKARFDELSRLARKRTVIDIDRIIPIVAHAVVVFGDAQKASHWLVTPLALLGDRSPSQILAGGGDGEDIERILTRIEYDIPS